METRSTNRIEVVIRNESSMNHCVHIDVILEQVIEKLIFHVALFKGHFHESNDEESVRLSLFIDGCSNYLLIEFLIFAITHVTTLACEEGVL